MRGCVSSGREGLDASEISYAPLSEADDDVDPAIIDAIGQPDPGAATHEEAWGRSLV